MQLEIFQRDLVLQDVWSSARTHRDQVASVVDIELRSSDGVIGFGEASPVGRYNESAAGVTAILSQLQDKIRNVNDTGLLEVITTRLSALSPAVSCSVNVAVTDFTAKLAKTTVHSLLGLKFQEGKYLTSFTIGLDTPAIIRKKVEAASHFPILKMKVGSDHDRKNLAALRDVAPNKPIRLDANEAWTTKESALQNIKSLAEDGQIQFVEQPMPASAPIEDWIWLKKNSPLPIFGDESYHQAADAERAAQCFHGVNVKLVKAGGIIGALHALQAARRLGLKTMLGCMIETSLLVSAAAHLAELCDYLDLDGNLLITNDPYSGVTAQKGILSFAGASEPFGLRVCPRLAGG